MARELVIAYDLGTSGIKASLFNRQGLAIGDSLVTYNTVYTDKTWHEQNPMQWWHGVVACTQKLLKQTGADPSTIVALSISGHSLGAVPVAADGTVLTELTPIWSDGRAIKLADRFFKKTDYESWYMTTGNGFPREYYAIFKMMWCREHQPDVYRQTACFLGSKDLCNYFLTGRMCTDPSYASGSGVYDLQRGCYVTEYIRISGVEPEKLPPIVGSNEVIGNLTRKAAETLGLDENVKVVCGGVDNACMALGAKGIANQRAYMSLGSSAWIAVVSDHPILTFPYKPFVFAHVIKGMYASATSIFAAGTSMRWARENLCPDLVQQEERGMIKDSYTVMNEWIARSPIGAKRLLFNPSLTGGSMIEQTPLISGGFIGLNVSHNRDDLLRAIMEGITYNLRWALEVLQSTGETMDRMLVVGGGSKSRLWRQMFADVFGCEIIKTNIDQNAASLGAAALAFVGAGLWENYDIIDEIHKVASIETPIPEHCRQYAVYYDAFRKTTHQMSEIGSIIAAIPYEETKC
ncbi:MAG: FGGY family carbohydrate kinase [Eubacteriales bacterium]|nr:FGGY family carbohydrate kinase [Eubacteriales bacterium]